MKLDPEAFKRGKDTGAARPAAGGGRAGGIRQRVPVRPRAGHRGRAGVQGAHRRPRGRAAPRRAARHPAAPAGAGLQRPDPGPRPPRPAHQTRPSRPGIPPATRPTRTTARGDAGAGEDDRTGGRDSTGRDGDEDDASWDGCPDMPEWQHERRGTREDDDHDGPGPPPGPPAPFPALINLTVPAGTAYGWSSAPGDAGGWGLTDADDTRRLLQAASMHPRTRWRVTQLAPDGTAAAHGCARGPHPWIPPPARRHLPGRSRHPAGSRARRIPARPEHHPHPDRQRQLRPRQPRRPLHPQPQTQRPDPRPHRPLHRPRLRRPGRPLRPRPHPPLPRRNHLPVRPRTRLPPPPPLQASTRLAARPTRTRHHALDHAIRPQLHHPAHHLRDLTWPTIFGLCRVDQPGPVAAGQFVDDVTVLSTGHQVSVRVVERPDPAQPALLQHPP